MRASDSPMAMACFGLVTFFPLPPDLSFPCFISRISRSTALLAAGLYLRELDDFFEALFFTDDFFAEDEEFFVDEDFLDEEDFFRELFFAELFFFVAIVVPPRSVGRATKQRGCRMGNPFEREEHAGCYCLSEAMSITKRYFTSALSTRSKASLTF